MEPFPLQTGNVLVRGHTTPNTARKVQDLFPIDLNFIFYNPQGKIPYTSSVSMVN
jgi:hypothetical protein